MKYIPLNIKTEYDLMNSLIKIDELISYALNNDIKCLGITDENMFGAYDFYNKCIKNNIKPIIGTEINNLIIYARNYDGYVSLCNIVSEKNTSEISLDDIIKYDKNIIVVTTKEEYSKYKDKFTYLYVRYNNEKDKKESLLLTNNVVYIDLIRYFSLDDKEYFKYIKYIKDAKTIDEEMEIEDSYFKENNNVFDIESTHKFSDLINIEFPTSKLHIPVYKEDSLSYLKALCKKGLEKRLNGNVSDEYKNRLIYELSVIEQMNFTDYFLIVYDFILYAKKHDIMVGPGRGSGAGSLVNYSLGIINIDPLKYDLIFERFLNPGRITMPDIDVDFDNTKREEVIDYVSEKYGINNTARIISFNTMLPKQVIRDVSKVLKMDTILIDRICKTIKDEKDFNALKDNIEFRSIISRNNDAKKLINICSKLCGLVKNTSMHAAGVVISDTPLSNIMPMYKSSGVLLTGYSMEHIESLGLLKMDFLSIKNLNTISNIVSEIKNDNIDINIDNIDLNDKETLDLFKKANTSGIFQFESDGMRSFLSILEVDNFNTLVDAIALYRPGPRDMIDEYVLRKKGKKKVTYLIPELEPILKSTYGIIIYQEQVLDILKNVAGYSYSEADLIRRAMSKKKESIISENKSIFTDRLLKKGYTREVIDELYSLIIKFSSYGFNKSHSVVYSLVAYQMAYLKVHYSSYFMKNLLNMNKNSEKLKNYIDESKILNIEFENININKSCYDFVNDKNKLVMPFSIINSISLNVSNEIEMERNNGKFKDFYDFMKRCYSKSVNKKVVIALIECGAFDEFNLNKKQTIDNIEEVLNYVSLCRDLSLDINDKPVFNDIEDYTDAEIVNNEIKNYGFYLSHHPVTKYDRKNMITLENISMYFNKTITSILFLEDIKTIKTKNNDKMSFIKLSDEYNSIEGIIFPKEYNNLLDIEKNNIYQINAKVEKRNNSYQLIIYKMLLLKK